MEDEWQEKLVADAMVYTAEEAGTSLRNFGAKWRVTSALQKTIRLGQTDRAHAMVHALHAADANYTWRRLCTIVMEDVGIGDVNLVARFLWVATQPVWREANGGELLYLYMLVQQMCESVKDRNANDLPGWGEMDPDFAEHRAAIQEMPLEALTETLVDPEVAPVIRCLVFQHLGYFQHQQFSKAQGFKAASAALLEAGCDPLLVAIARMGRSKQYETQPYAFPFLWYLAAASEHDVAPDQLFDFPPIRGYPSSAFDKHCREGRRVITRWYKTCTPLREALTAAIPLDHEDPEAHRHALEALLFRVEGHLVDRRLVYAGSAEIDRECTRAHLEHNYVQAAFQAELLQLVKEHLPELHELRVAHCLAD